MLVTARYTWLLRVQTVQAVEGYVWLGREFDGTKKLFSWLQRVNEEKGYAGRCSRLTSLYMS